MEEERPSQVSFNPPWEETPKSSSTSTPSELLETPSQPIDSLQSQSRKLQLQQLQLQLQALQRSSPDGSGTLTKDTSKPLRAGEWLNLPRE